MSYCQPCRRHLNGAPECPGCGTPAEEIRNSAGPSATDDPPSGGDTEHVERPAARRHRGRSRPVHRRKRRRVLLVSAGAVLGLGALTMARITTEVPSANDGNSAASADTGIVGEDGPVGDTASPSSSASASPSTGDASASPSTSPEPSGSAAGADDKESGRDGTDGSGTGGSHSDTPPPATHDPAPTGEPAPSPTRTCVDWVVVKWCS